MRLDASAVAFSLEELRPILPRMPDGDHPDRRAVRRWLQRHQVPLDRVGKRDVVWLSDLAAALPQLQRALELRRAG